MTPLQILSFALFSVWSFGLWIKMSLFRNSWERGLRICSSRNSPGKCETYWCLKCLDDSSILCRCEVHADIIFFNGPLAKSQTGREQDNKYFLVERRAFLSVSGGSEAVRTPGSILRVVMGGEKSQITLSATWVLWTNIFSKVQIKCPLLHNWCHIRPSNPREKSPVLLMCRVLSTHLYGLHLLIHLTNAYWVLLLCQTQL